MGGPGSGGRRRWSKQRGLNLDAIIAALREIGVPATVREIVTTAGDRLPTKSKTPVTAVARDLAMNIIWYGDASVVVRTATGLYTLRELIARPT